MKFRWHKSFCAIEAVFLTFTNWLRKLQLEARWQDKGKLKFMMKTNVLTFFDCFFSEEIFILTFLCISWTTSWFLIQKVFKNLTQICDGIIEGTFWLEILSGHQRNRPSNIRWARKLQHVVSLRSSMHGLCVLWIWIECRSTFNWSTNQ